MPKIPEYPAATAAEMDDSDQFVVDVDGVTKSLSKAEQKKGNDPEIIEVPGTTRTLLESDLGNILWCTNNSGCTITINTISGLTGSRPFIVQNNGTGTVTVQSGTATLNSSPVTIEEGEAVAFVHLGSNVWARMGVASTGGGGGDVTAPTLVSATVEDANPDQLILTYDEALDDSAFPAGGDYTPSGGRTVSSVAVVGAVVTLTVNTPYTNSDTVTIGYDSGSALNPLKDLAGNQAADLTAEPVTNNVVGGYDADAITVITAIETAIAGSLSTGDKDAINGRIVALKAQSKWTNMKAYYGYVGGTAAAHAINWKSPGTFDITWAGGITHSSTGVLFNGTTGYGNTGINDNTVLTLDDVTIGGYSRISSNNGFMMGVYDSTGPGSLYLADQNTMSVAAHDVTGLSSATTPTRLMIVARQTAAPKLAIYRDGTQLTVDSASATGKLNGNIYVGAINNLSSGGASGFSDKEYASHFIYDGGFTAAEVTQFSTDEQTYQTALGRSV